jgi:Domain of unknown function (DUF4201)
MAMIRPLAAYGLQVQSAKLELQLQAKENLGEALMPVDFDQLKIENRQIVDRLQGCNSELLNLKTRQGKIALVLHSHGFGRHLAVSLSISAPTAVQRMWMLLLRLPSRTACLNLCEHASHTSIAHGFMSGKFC